MEEGDSFDPKSYQLEYPVIVKPNSTDGSFGRIVSFVSSSCSTHHVLKGITQKSVCYNLEQVTGAVDQIRNTFHIRGPILLQEFLTGYDVNVGVMERKVDGEDRFEPWVLPISEEDYSALPEGLPRILGFESKV